MLHRSLRCPATSSSGACWKGLRQLTNACLAEQGLQKQHEHIITYPQRINRYPLWMCFLSAMILNVQNKHQGYTEIWMGPAATFLRTTIHFQCWRQATFFASANGRVVGNNIRCKFCTFHLVEKFQGLLPLSTSGACANGCAEGTDTELQCGFMKLMEKI